MQLVELQLHGIRGFPTGDRGVSLSFARKDDSLPRWIVVAGRNGAGKSTFLQAIALAIAGPSVGRLLAETFQGWIRDRDDHGVAGAKIRFCDSDGFTTTGRRPKFEPWVAMEWTRAAGPEPTLAKHSIGGNWNPHRGPWAENPRGWFTAGYGPFRRLSSAPTEAQRLMISPGRPAALASLFREDASLSEAIVWLQQLYLRRLEKRPEAEALEQLVLRVLDDGLLPEGMRVRSVDSEGLWVSTPEEQRLALASLSDGYRTVAGLVLDIIKQLASAYGTIHSVEGDDGHVQILHEGVVFIDEIDVHLHVEWQKRIGFWLKSRFPKIQFVVTTHSPFICQAADEGGLIRLSPPWAGEYEQVAESLSGEVFNRVVNGTLDEAVVTELFGLDTVLSDDSQAARLRIAEIEAIALTRELSKVERRDLRKLRTRIPDSQADRAQQVALTHAWLQQQ